MSPGEFIKIFSVPPVMSTLACVAVLAVLTGRLLWIGIYPAPLIDLIHRMSATLM